METKHESNKPELDMEVTKSILATLSLTSFTLGDYLVVTRDEFDVILSGDPYIALMVLFNLKTGRFITRVWNETLKAGFVENVDQVASVCRRHFEGVRPCIGRPVDSCEEETIVNIPLPRKVSKNCHKVVKSSQNVERQCCPECLKSEDILPTKGYEDHDCFVELVGLDENDIEPPEAETSTVDAKPVIKEDDERHNLLYTKLDQRYERLITEALVLSTGQELSVKEICQIISNTYPFVYDMSKKGWKNSIRYTLAVKPHFEKVPGRDGHWRCRNKEESGTLYEFKCKQCDFVASLANDLIKHMRVEEHTQDPAVDCPKCKKEFFMSGILPHFERCIPKPKKKTSDAPMDCPWCEKTVRHYDFHWHMSSEHRWGAFWCLECSHKANFADDLVEHMEQESHADAPYIICPSCDDTFPMMEVDAHYVECLASRPKHQPKKLKAYQCSTCDKVLRGKQKYNIHIKTHLRAQGLTEEEAKMSLYYYCDKCDKRFTQRYVLTDHMRSDHSNVKLKCPLCHLTFRKRTELSKHKIIAHSADTKYVCQFCEKRFRSEKTRITHERVHKEPEFQCHFCAKLLKSEEALEGHEKMHTGEKPFTCSICDTGFTSKKNIDQHMRGKHKVAGPKGGKPGWRHRLRIKK